MAGQLSQGSHGIFPDVFALFAIKDVYQSETLTGATTIDGNYPSALKLDPGGANRNVTLEAETAAHHGKVRFIVNGADAAENLVILDPDANTIATINQNEAALLYNDGANGWQLVCIWTIALS